MFATGLVLYAAPSYIDLRIQPTPTFFTCLMQEPHGPPFQDVPCFPSPWLTLLSLPNLSDFNLDRSIKSVLAFQFCLHRSLQGLRHMYFDHMHALFAPREIR